MYKKVVACDIFTCGFCNAQCKYCYIPKVPEMHEIHDYIVEKLKSGKYIEELRVAYKDRLEHLSFWGTEPTLILDYITEKIEYFFVAFPKLKGISFSSNMLKNTDTIHRFLLKLDNLSKLSGRKIDCSVQISLDGPDCITDSNRQLGATNTIVENYKKLVLFVIENIKSIKVEVTFKPTLSIENIELFNNNSNLFYEYFKLFDNLYDFAVDNGKPKNLNIPIPLSGTLVVPGTYTSDNGREFSNYINNLFKFNMDVIENHPYKHIYGDLFSYTNRLANLIIGDRAIFSNHRMFTCSAGDSMNAIDENGNIHLCHRSFFLNNEIYEKSVLNRSDIKNWDVSIFESNKNNIIKKNYIVPFNEDSSRMDYIERNFHDFPSLKITSTKAYVMELARIGQANPIYLKNDKLLDLFALFIGTTFACPMENLLNTGVLHFAPLSTIRIWANGAFEELINYYNHFESH